MATVEGIQVPEDVRRAVDIDPDELREELARTPGDLAREAARSAAAHGDYRRAKAARERKLGEILSDPDFAEQLKERLGKAPTVAQLEAAAKGSAEYLEALEEEIEADVERKRRGGFAKALQEKAALLVELSRLVRRETPRHDTDDDDDDDDEGEDEGED